MVSFVLNTVAQLTMEYAEYAEEIVPQITKANILLF